MQFHRPAKQGEMAPAGRRERGGYKEKHYHRVWRRVKKAGRVNGCGSGEHSEHANDIRRATENNCLRVPPLYLHRGKLLGGESQPTRWGKYETSLREHSEQRGP